MTEERWVARTNKDENGVIVALCSPGASWSPRSKAAAIQDIESGNYRYYVKWTDKTTEVKVVGSGANRYLRTDRDTTARNNLADLPAC